MGPLPFCHLIVTCFLRACDDGDQCDWYVWQTPTEDYACKTELLSITLLAMHNSISRAYRDYRNQQWWRWLGGKSGSNWSNMEIDYSRPGLLLLLPFLWQPWLPILVRAWTCKLTSHTQRRTCQNDVGCGGNGKWRIKHQILAYLGMKIGAGMLEICRPFWIVAWLQFRRKWSPQKKRRPVCNIFLSVKILIRGCHSEVFKLKTHYIMTSSVICIQEGKGQKVTRLCGREREQSEDNARVCQSGREERERRAKEKIKTMLR